MNIKQVLLLSAALLFLADCSKKYPEGPKFTLRSKEERLANNWAIEQYLLNGQDQTDGFRASHQNYLLTTVKSGTYVFSYNSGGSTLGESGTWKLDKGGTEWVTLSNVSGAASKTYTILRLKEKSFWCKRDSAGTVEEFHYKPQ